ncbi:hypothetical protein [Arenicella xantha]|uniref:Uncharacterized protein n=1 Tax=Arenicella xantha TaxID=644221 RepID=A0A395JUV7_9GAMM|nr:hypothetical protein [Arenicella xantha]RBP53348.1 hypothetical protein DFR28_101734 [Arenicella xantha]
MLRQIVDVRQQAGECEKRWFNSSEVDLFIWFDSLENIISFHLIYDKHRDEKAVIWNKLSSALHVRVDDNSRPGHYPSSPLLTERVALDTQRLISLLGVQMQNVDPAITRFILRIIDALD